MQEQFRLTGGVAGSANALLLDLVAGVAESGRVDEEDGDAAQVGRLLDGVARGAGDRRDDRAVASQELIQQARFAGIGTPKDGDAETATQDLAFTRRREEFLDPGKSCRQAFLELRTRRWRDVFLREIDVSFDMREGHHQVISKRINAPGEGAGELFVGSRKGEIRAGMNQVRDRLRLRQVQPAIEEGAAGEFARLGASRAGSEKRIEDLARHEDTAVTGDFHHILPRKRARRAHDRQEHLIDPATLPDNVAVMNAVTGGLRRTQAAWTRRLKRAFRDLEGLASRDPQDRNAALAKRRGDGDNCVRFGGGWVQINSRNRGTRAGHQDLKRRGGAEGGARCRVNTRGLACGGVRVAFLTHEPFHPPSGGGSAAAVYLVRHLVARGHSVEVFGPALAHPAEIEHQFGIRIRGFDGWRMGRTTSLRTFKYLAYPTALTRWVARTVRSEGSYDVCVSQHSISAVAAGRLRRRLGVPAVFNLLDCLTGFLETWPRCLMPRSVARRLVRYELSLPRRFEADAVLTVSDPLRHRVIARGYPPNKVRAIYYGYDSDLFRSVPGILPAGGAPQPTIVMHGSFDHHHLGPIAKRAVIAAHRGRPGIRFRFVGPRTPALRRFLQEVRHEEPAVLLEDTGFIPYERVPEMLRDATVGITPYEPSTGTHCAFVAKTVEYLALGLPVVCTPLESALQYYSGLEGVTFAGGEGSDFGGAILAWLEKSAEDRRHAVERARRKVEAELDWGTVCARAAEFIEAAVVPTRAR